MIATKNERARKEFKCQHHGMKLWRGGWRIEMIFYSISREMFLCSSIVWWSREAMFNSCRVDDIERHLHKININFEFKVLFWWYSNIWCLNCCVLSQSKSYGKIIFLQRNSLTWLMSSLIVLEFCLFWDRWVGGNIERNFFLLQLSILKGQTNFD